MPRNQCSRDRLNHGRAHVVAARRRLASKRFRRLKQQGLHPYRQRLGGVIALGRFAGRAAAEAELKERLGVSDERCHLFVHPDDVRRLPLPLRRELYLDWPPLGALPRKLRYRRGLRDPWDWPVPLAALPGARSRARARWRREAWAEALERTAQSDEWLEGERPAEEG